MSVYRAPQASPREAYSKEEQWEYLEEGFLKKSRSACVCMTCQYFDYSCDKNLGTVLTCIRRRGLIPQGIHLTSKCPLWHQRIEQEIGWCLEAA